MISTNLVLVRHGESLWNKENRFTGWIDVDLSEKGYDEAKKAGILLRSKNFVFDKAYTSLLKRAIHTLWVILDELDQAWLTVEKSWRLNERHYGALQGYNKTEIANKYGNEQVKIWRRSFDIAPPTILEKMNNTNKYKEDIIKNIDYKYRDIQHTIPDSESLLQTTNRVLPYIQKNIIPRIIKGENILIVSHGNTIRAIIKILSKLTDKEILNIDIPTGIPIFYQLEKNIDDINKKKNKYSYII